MLCRDPYQKGDALFPCGRCMPCRVSRRKVWTHRIKLEALCHEHSSFVTLTYSDSAVPVGVGGDQTLDPRHPRDWLKRIRERVSPLKLRYYLVGEYGGVTGRPHYHLALFGYPPCAYGRTQHKERCCAQCDLVRDTWGFGHVVNGTLTAESAAYVAGYITKKYDPAPAGVDRVELFARMSLRPGIGAAGVRAIAETLREYDLVKPGGDVPAGLAHGRKVMPFGQYLRRKLRAEMGMEVTAPESTLLAAKEEMSVLWQDAQNAPQGLRGSTFKALWLDATQIKVDQMRNKMELKRQNEAF